MEHSSSYSSHFDDMKMSVWNGILEGGQELGIQPTSDGDGICII